MVFRYVDFATYKHFAIINYSTILFLKQIYYVYQKCMLCMCVFTIAAEGMVLYTLIQKHILYNSLNHFPIQIVLFYFAIIGFPNKC